MESRLYCEHLIRHSMMFITNRGISLLNVNWQTNHVECHSDEHSTSHIACLSSIHGDEWAIRGEVDSRASPQQQLPCPDPAAILVTVPSHMWESWALSTWIYAGDIIANRKQLRLTKARTRETQIACQHRIIRTNIKIPMSLSLPHIEIRMAFMHSMRLWCEQGPSDLRYIYAILARCCPCCPLVHGCSDATRVKQYCVLRCTRGSKQSIVACRCYSPLHTK